MKFFLSLILSLTMFLPTARTETIELSTKNVLVYDAQVDEETTMLAQLILQRMVQDRGTQDYPLYLVLDCPGGAIYAGEQFIQFAKMIPNLHTISIFAASMCSAIVEALPGKRYVTENGVLMFHRAKGRFEGQFEEGEVEAQLALWKTIVRGMEQRNSDRIGIPLEKYKLNVANEWWLWGKQCVKEGAADAVVDIKCTDELIEADACPLFRFR